MQDKLIRKGLIVGIIVLLIGVGITQVATSTELFLSNSKSYNMESIIGLRNIMLTGYWNPTGQMIAEFSTDPYLNPGGWKGENWEGLGYNIYSFFPTPYTYNGTFEVDYQNTWDDFWTITEDINPIAIVSFGAGNGPWEIEYNARNLDSWIPDNEPPYQPTPCPPDDSVPAGYIRHSTLPVQAIADAVNEQTNVYAWIDWDGNPGAYLCEYMAYLGMWYQDIHNDSSDAYRCWEAGFVHVKSSLALEDAKEATKVTIREVIKSLEEFVASADGPYTGYVYEKIQFKGYAVGGVPPYSWHWNFGDGNTSDEQNPIHIYTSPDKYTVILTVTDSENNVAIDDTWAFIPGSIPIPPPIIDGPASGEVGIEYYYSFVTIHHLGYDLSYFIEWGDGEITDWTALLPSGIPYNESHKWTSKGKYIIKAKARDVWGTESDWATFDVTMPRNRATQRPFLQFLQNFLQQYPILYQLLQRFLRL